MAVPPPPPIHAIFADTLTNYGIKAMSHGISAGKQVINLPLQVIDRTGMWGFYFKGL